MPGLKMSVQAITTPGIRGLLDKRPDIKRRVARAHVVSVLRVQSGAKSRAPVKTGRLKTSITNRALDQDDLIHVIGTNVVSAPPGTKRRLKGRKRKFRARVPKGGYRSAGGYPYPRRMEFDTKLHHKTGEWGYLRKSLAAEERKHNDQCLRALIRGLKGYE